MPNACHPFSTKDRFVNNYVGVHNGVIHNDNELEKQHMELGINYVSRQPNGEFNDSEALIYDIARYLEGEVDELTAKGSIAFIMVKRDKRGKPRTLFFGHNSGNPLVMKRTNHSITISSEGEGESLKVNTLYSYDYDTGTITERYLLIPTAYSYSSYGNRGGSTQMGFMGNSSTSKASSDEEDEYYTAMAEEYAREELESVLPGGEMDIRTGSRSAILADVLRDNKGDFRKASMEMLIEATEVEEEQSRVNTELYGVYSNEAMEYLEDYWYSLQQYKLLILGIAEELEESSNKIQTSKVVLEGEVTVLEEERSLLPLAA